MKKMIDGTVATMIVVVVLIVTITGTFAWYNGRIASDNTNLGKSAKLDIEYTDGFDEVLSGSLIPVKDKSGGISTTAKIGLKSDSVAAKLRLSLELTTFTAVLGNSEALTYEVYKGSTRIATGNFKGKSQGNTVDILTNHALTTTAETFTVYVWLDGSKSGNEVQNATFKANLYASTEQITGNNG